MAKEAKETKPAVNAATVKDGEVDILAQIDSKVKMSADVAKQAAEEIAKKNKERRVEEMKQCLMKADYVKQTSLLVLRKSREEEKADKAFLTKLTELEQELKDGKHDTTSYDKRFIEARKEKKEAYAKASATYDEYANKLNQNFSNFDTWSWQRLVNSNF